MLVNRIKCLMYLNERAYVSDWKSLYIGFFSYVSDWKNLCIWFKYFCIWLKEIMYIIERTYVSDWNSFVFDWNNLCISLTELMYLIEKAYVSDLNSCRFKRWPSATFFYKEFPCRGLVFSSDWNCCRLIETLVVWLKLLSSDWNSCRLIETYKQGTYKQHVKSQAYGYIYIYSKVQDYGFE